MFRFIQLVCILHSGLLRDIFLEYTIPTVITLTTGNKKKNNKKNELKYHFSFKNVTCFIKYLVQSIHKTNFKSLLIK